MRGTRIATARGEVPVEALVPGESVAARCRCGGSGTGASTAAGIHGRVAAAGRAALADRGWNDYSDEYAGGAERWLDWSVLPEVRPALASKGAA